MSPSHTTVAAISAVALVVAACHKAPEAAPAPRPAVAAAPARPSAPPPAAAAPTAPPPAASAPAVPGAPGASGGPGGPGGRRPRLAPDSVAKLRAGMLKTVAATIAGRENEPAESVFKNIQVLKGKTAGELLKTMDSYGNALSALCSSCHVPNDWQADTRPNKVRARVMQQMTTAINNEHLTKLDEKPERPVTCMTCHRGLQHPNESLDAGLQRAIEAAAAAKAAGTTSPATPTSPVRPPAGTDR